MNKLTTTDLFSLEEYHRARVEFRAQVLAHKKHRRLSIGPNATLVFEDRLTIQYQIQEMLRIERIFETEGINEELLAYNPLIPDGTNLKATFLVEFPEAEERREALARLVGIEDRVWLQAAGHERCYAIADEDLDRSTADKTSAVHFLRFEFPMAARAALAAGAELSAGIDHPDYDHRVDPVVSAIRESLCKDFAPLN
jgi:hypothetical protein